MNNTDSLPKRKNSRLKGFNYNNVGVYFITICTLNRRCILSEIKNTDTIEHPCVKLTEYGKIAEKYLNQLNNHYDYFLVDSYVIMPNHIHIMLTISENEQLKISEYFGSNSLFSNFISTFKRFCNREYGENIWQTRSHDHIIRNREDYEKHMKYIYENPMRWQFDELYSKE